MGDKIGRKEATKQRVDAALFGYCIGLGVGAYIAFGYGKTAGHKEAQEQASLRELYSTVRQLSWEAEERKMRDKEAASGRTD